MNHHHLVMALQVQVQFLIFFLVISFATCFLSINNNGVQQHQVKKTASSSSSSSSSSRLFGINEWRDLDFNLPGRSRNTLGINDEAPPRSICILPFPYTEVLLQGETKQLRLYEERFIKLFQNVQEHHAGVVGMGLMANSGNIIQTMPICEVEASNTMEGFGIFVTIRVVGRASLLEITQQEPYLRGACIEVADILPPNLELPNLLANNIENHMLLLSSMEQRFKEVVKLGNINSSGDNNTSSSANTVQDDEMAARIALAKLEDRFYASDDDDDDDDPDDEDDEENTRLDRRGRYRQAYQIALSTDTQGYSVSGSTGSDSGQLSAQELTATSWAAFCSEIVAEDDATYRIQALDTDKLFDRLKLAAYMLREKKSGLEKLMTKEGIKFREKDKNDDDNNDGDIDDKRDRSV